MGATSLRIYSAGWFRSQITSTEQPATKSVPKKTLLRWANQFGRWRRSEIYATFPRQARPRCWLPVDYFAWRDLM